MVAIGDIGQLPPARRHVFPVSSIKPAPYMPWRYGCNSGMQYYLDGLYDGAVDGSA